MADTTPQAPQDASLKRERETVPAVEGAVEEANKKIKTDDADLFEIRCLIDNLEASIIIGKGGANVRAVRTESGAFVSILKNEPNSTKERVMTVKGPEGTIPVAVRAIATLLIDAAKAKKVSPTGEAPTEAELDITYGIKILIHKFLAGSIIGKGGAIIKEMQESSKARIQLSNDALAGSTEKTVTITGNADTIFDAITRVVNQLSQNPVRAGSNVVPYVPGQAVAAAQFQPQYGAPHPYGAPYGAPPSPYGVPPQQYGAPHQYGAPPASPYGAPAGAPPAAQAGPQKTEKIVIPTVCAGTVIGKQGSIIREIKAQSVTHITIAPPEPTAPGDRVVSVTGTAQGIQTAIWLIRQRVESYQPPAGPPGGAAPAGY